MTPVFTIAKLNVLRSRNILQLTSSLKYAELALKQGKITKKQHENIKTNYNLKQKSLSI